MPSTSRISRPAVPAGASRSPPRYRVTAARHSPSTSSSVAGTTRARISSLTASTAASMLSNVARSVAWAGGFGNQPQHRLRDDRERALGPDEQLRQVVADDALDGLRPGADDLAGRQHRLESEHVALGRAVLERARAARALGDVAADHRLVEAGRIRRIEQADLLDLGLQAPGHDVRLGHDEQVLLVDLEDPVEPLHRHQQRRRAAGRPRRCSRCRRRARRAARAARGRARAIAATSLVVPGSTTTSRQVRHLQAVLAVPRARRLVRRGRRRRPRSARWSARNGAGSVTGHLRAPGVRLLQPVPDDDLLADLDLLRRGRVERPADARHPLDAPRRRCRRS